MIHSRNDLFAYQRRAVQFIKDHPNCALWVEMGLGKSVTAATAYADMLDDFEAKSALVIAPLRVARKVWPDEIKCWDHLTHLRTAKIIGSEKNRYKGLSTPADIHLINQEQVVWLSEQFVEGKKVIRKFPWDLVILDESQGMRRQSSQRFKALSRLRKLFPRLIELTGTPAPNGYRNLWSQVKLMDGGLRLGTTETDFLERWFDREFGDGYVNWHIKSHSAKQIQDAVRDIVLSLRVEDYFDLPPVVFNLVRVSLSPAAVATYKRFERTYCAQVGSKTITAANAGALNSKVMQLANGSIYVDNKGTFELFHDAKIDALCEILDGVSGPTIIGYAFRADASRISAALNKFCGKDRWAFADTDEDLERFAKGDLDFIVMHPASAGHGLNDLHLSGAETIVWFGLTDNLEWFQQLNARLTGGLRRIGKNIIIHIILADDTVDMRMSPRLTDKAATQDGLTKALAEYVREIL